MTMREKIARAIDTERATIERDIPDLNQQQAMARPLADAALRAFAEPDDETVERIARAIAKADRHAYDAPDCYYDPLARAVCQAIADMAAEF